MRFRIFADDILVYDPNSPALSHVTEANLQQEVNRSGMFTFTLSVGHPAYNQIEKMKSIITLYSDDELIFRGRVFQVTDNFIQERHYVCEGELSFLLDSIQRPYDFNGLPNVLLSRLLTNHNAQVEPAKRFVLGTVTVTDPNVFIMRESETYDNTYTNIEQKLLDPLGGYLFVESNATGERVLNWYAEPPNEATQKIVFGENLLDFSKFIDADGLATALIPLGAEEEATESGEKPKRLTIKSVNGGLDYIYDWQSVDQYGWIYKVETWDEVTDATSLLNKATDRLAELKNSSLTIDLSAIDLSAINADIAQWKLGDKIRVISSPHGIDATYILTAQTLDLLHPENNKIKLGQTYKSFTGYALANAMASTEAGQIANRIDADYVPAKDFESATESISEQFGTTEQDILDAVAATYATISSVAGLAGYVEANTNKLNKIDTTGVSEIGFDSSSGTSYITFKDLGNNKYRLTIDSTGLTLETYSSSTWVTVWTVAGTP